MLRSFTFKKQPPLL